MVHQVNFGLETTELLKAFGEKDTTLGFNDVDELECYISNMISLKYDALHGLLESLLMKRDIKLIEFDISIKRRDEKEVPDNDNYRQEAEKIAFMNWDKLSLVIGSFVFMVECTKEPRLKHIREAFNKGCDVLATRPLAFEQPVIKNNW